MRHLLFVIALLACRAAEEQQSATTVPRFKGQLDSAEARWVDGLSYSPADAPLAWHHADSLLIIHVEQYASNDVAGSTCSGSGIFSVPVVPGSARALAVGYPACLAAQYDASASVDATGRLVVFSVRTPPNNSSLARLDLASSRVDTLRTGCRVYAEEPSWMPKGDVLAFKGLCESRDQDEWVLYTVDADGTDLRMIPGESGHSASSPSWSPDGSRLAYVRTPADLNSFVSQVAVVDPHGAERRVLARGRSPAWSPDGQWLAYVSDSIGETRSSELRLIRSDGTGDRLLYRSPDRTTFSRGWGPIRQGLPTGPLVWSPDGQWLAFRRGFDRGTFVWRVQIGTGEVRPVTRR